MNPLFKVESASEPFATELIVVLCCNSTHSRNYSDQIDVFPNVVLSHYVYDHRHSLNIFEVPAVDFVHERLDRFIQFHWRVSV